MTITEFIEAAAHNKIIQLVVLAIVCDTVFGVLRAIKEKKFNSCAGIDGAIRKVGMLISLVFMLAIDVLIKINLIGCKDGRNHRKGSIYHCGSESRTGCKRWLGTLEEWRRLD